MSPTDRFEMRRATLHLGERHLAGASGAFDVHFFRDLAQGTTAMSISTGRLDGAEPLLARVHSSCVTSECLMGRDCDCAEQLEGALARIAAEERGVVFYLLQEGRGAGLTAKARDRMMVQASGHRITTFDAYRVMGLPADLRSYDGVASMARLLDLRAPMRLLTNNPEKVAAVGEALDAEKLVLAGSEPLRSGSSPFNRHYLDAKQATGHGLGLDDRPGEAQPPRRPRVFEPFALGANGRDPGDRVVTASYFLPIGLEGTASPEPPVWFRASVLFDRSRSQESVLLAPLRPDDAPRPDEAAVARDAARVEQTIEMELLDRLPFRGAAFEAGDGSAAARPDGGTLVQTDGRARLAAALRSLSERGEGAVEVRFDEHAGARP